MTPRRQYAEERTGKNCRSRQRRSDSCRMNRIFAAKDHKDMNLRHACDASITDARWRYFTIIRNAARNPAWCRTQSKSQRIQPNTAKMKNFSDRTGFLPQKGSKSTNLRFLPSFPLPTRERQSINLFTCPSVQMSWPVLGPKPGKTGQIWPNRGESGQKHFLGGQGESSLVKVHAPSVKACRVQHYFRLAQDVVPGIVLGVEWMQAMTVGSPQGG
jgi:hypothetical protein